MRYVQRDATGVVVGHYANPQAGYAEEEVADDHPEIVAWEAAREAEATSTPSMHDAFTLLTEALDRIEVLESQLAELRL